MALRQLIIERPSLHGKNGPTPIRVNVDDRAAIGPWVATLAARFGYPLVDTFGSPLTYRLRSLSGEYLLLTTGRFADARFPSGSRFIIEPERQSTMPMREQRWEGKQANQTPFAAMRFSRRALISVLSAFSFLGFSSGMTTVFAQRLLTQPTEAIAQSPEAIAQSPEAITPISVRTLFDQHQQSVRTLTWSPDGERVASGGNDGMVFVWNRDGTVLYRHQFSAPVRALAWSPDGTQLLTGTANTISFFDARTGVLLAENATQHTASITSLGWTQGSTHYAVSAGTDKTAAVWSAQSHQPLMVFRGHTSAIEALAAFETIVVTASEGGLARTWSVLSGQEIHGYYSQSQHPLRTVAFSSRGSLAIGGDDGVIHLWNDARTCQHQTQDVFGVHCIDGAIHLQGHTQTVRALTFSPDGMQLATGGDDKKLIIWSMQTMKPLLIQLQQDASVALSWSPTGHFLAGALGQRVALWQIHL